MLEFWAPCGQDVERSFVGFLFEAFFILFRWHERFSRYSAFSSAWRFPNNVGYRRRFTDSASASLTPTDKKTETVLVSFLCAAETECLHYSSAWWKDRKLLTCWRKGGSPEHEYCLNVGTFWMTLHNERKQGLSLWSVMIALLFEAGFVVVWGKPFLNIIIWFMPRRTKRFHGGFEVFHVSRTGETGKRLV